MVLHGKEKALEHIGPSSIAFIGKVTHAQLQYSSVSMPPIDHYVVQFDHKDLRTLRGRVYDTMIDFEYNQVKLADDERANSLDVESRSAREFFRPAVTSIVAYAKSRFTFRRWATSTSPVCTSVHAKSMR